MKKILFIFFIKKYKRVFPEVHYNAITLSLSFSRKNKVFQILDFFLHFRSLLDLAKLIAKQHLNVSVGIFLKIIDNWWTI